MPEEKTKKQAIPTTPSKKEVGLPLGVNKNNSISPEKLKALQDYAAGIRDMAGVSGDVALRSFANGVGVDFKINGNELISEIRAKGDSGLYIDGKPAVKNKNDLEMLRGFLKEHYKISDAKSK
jgi:hypothetical protein